jgi:hypothetical protein
VGPRQARQAVWGAAAAVALLVACTAPRYTYVASRRHATFFKVPNDWKVFDQDTLLKANGAPADQASQVKATTWAVGLDASPKPSVQNTRSVKSVHPVGLATARDLAPDERDTYSMASLRSELLGNDPIAVASQGDSGVQVVSARDIERPHGLHGSELVVTIRQDDGGTATLHQVALLDATAKRISVLGIFCRADCYKANQRVIDQVISSWTVRE